jgi:uncharacterized membrane protein YqaE (UPF0057 family)
MSLPRALLAIFLPPLAVLDKGCGAILIVTLLTALGWLPGVLAALILSGDRKPQTVIIYQQLDGTKSVPPAAESIQTPKPVAVPYKKPMSLDEMIDAIRKPIEKVGGGIQAIWNSLRGSQTDAPSPARGPRLALGLAALASVSFVTLCCLCMFTVVVAGLSSTPTPDPEPTIRATLTPLPSQWTPTPTPE